MNNISYKKGILKKIVCFPKKDRILIEQFLDNLETCSNPKILSNCRKLVGFKDYYRYKIGNYRIICEILENNIINILIIDIGHRKDIYRKL